MYDIFYRCKNFQEFRQVETVLKYISEKTNNSIVVSNFFPVAYCLCENDKIHRFCPRHNEDGSEKYDCKVHLIIKKNEDFKVFKIKMQKRIASLKWQTNFVFNNRFKYRDYTLNPEYLFYDIDDFDIILNNNFNFPNHT